MDDKIVLLLLLLAATGIVIRIIQAIVRCKNIKKKNDRINYYERQVIYMWQKGEILLKILSALIARASFLAQLFTKIADNKDTSEDVALLLEEAAKIVRETKVLG